MTTWSSPTKNTTTWGNITESPAQFYLERETGDYILREQGDAVLLENSKTSWGLMDKTLKGSYTWSSPTKN